MNLKNKKLLKRLLLGLSILSILIVLSIIASLALAFQDKKFNAPIPHTWALTSGKGSISGLCFGGWEECGVIERTYFTSKSANLALEELKSSVDKVGWTLESSSEVGVDPQVGKRTTATIKDKPDNHDQIAYIELTENKAIIKYVHR